jgi:CRP/FNR family cyclic AMP-dependent transcriptional regulator
MRSPLKTDDQEANDEVLSPPLAPPARAPSRREGRLLATLLGSAFPGIAPPSVDHLVETAVVTTLRQRDLVYGQGEPVRLTIVLRGYAVFRQLTPDGREVIHGIVRPGAVFGHTGIARQLAFAEAMAVTPAQVASWSGEEVRDLLPADPALALAVVDAMAHYIIRMGGRMDRYMHQEARRRVLRVLAEHGDLFFGEPPVIARAFLPAVVGTSREMTGRVLRSLEAEGVVKRIGRRGLRLLRPDALEGVAEPDGALA